MTGSRAPAHIGDGGRLASRRFLVRRPDPTVSLGIFDWVAAQGDQSCHRDFPGSDCERDACAAVEIETAARSKSLPMALRKRMSALLLQAVSSAALGLRRLTSENLEDSPQVMVGALLVSASRHDAALEQIIGRMSLEPFDTVVHWQAEQAAAQS